MSDKEALDLIEEYQWTLWYNKGLWYCKGDNARGQGMTVRLAIQACAEDQLRKA